MVAADDAVGRKNASMVVEAGEDDLLLESLEDPEHDKNHPTTKVTPTKAAAGAALVAHLFVDVLQANGPAGSMVVYSPQIDAAVPGSALMAARQACKGALLVLKLATKACSAVASADPGAVMAPPPWGVTPVGLSTRRLVLFGRP
jgi:hypothetical protein